MANLQNHAFNSEYRYERVNSLKGHIGFSLGAWGDTTFGITHNLGYIPYFKLWWQGANGRVFDLAAGPYSYGIAGDGLQVNDVHANTSQILVEMSENNGAAAGGTIYYRIYEEQAVA